MQWYRRAAEQGNASAQYNLGNMYDYGQGVPQDFKEAAKWYRLSAEQGRANSQLNIGIMQTTGAGLENSYVQVQMWWNLDAANGYEGAAQNRDKVAKDMSPSQLADAIKLADDWAPKTQ